MWRQSFTFLSFTVAQILPRTGSFGNILAEILPFFLCSIARPNFCLLPAKNIFHIFPLLYLFSPLSLFHSFLPTFTLLLNYSSIFLIFVSFSYFLFLIHPLLLSPLPDHHNSYYPMQRLSIRFRRRPLLSPLLPRYAGECGPPSLLKKPAPPSRKSLKLIQADSSPYKLPQSSQRLGPSWMHGGQSKTA